MISRWTMASVVALCLALAGFALMIGLFQGNSAAQASSLNNATHLGVSSCAGSTCHGRTVGDGKVVRQDELKIWQEPSSITGAHSRAYAVLKNSRSQQIARKLGIGNAAAAPMCLGCHLDNATSRGPLFQVSDGVGCEACHGGAAGWIDVHKAGNHRASVAAGLVPLENTKAKAAVCLDCHFGSNDDGQFVNHRIMAAGHPRISFELDLFSTLQTHHDEDADYSSRKGGRTNGVRVWAVGQAMALDRALGLFSNPGIGAEGAFPEFYFFDCHSCHRPIYDSKQAVSTIVNNPGRPIPYGMPPFNDENMIMLSAAARVSAPELAKRLDTDSRAFHAAIAKDRASAVSSAARLRTTAQALADHFAAANFSRAETFAMIDIISSDATAPRFTDYAGSAQAVMAVDTLLNALVNSGQTSAQSAAAIRPNIDRAYKAVSDPNKYRPAEFRVALGSAVRTIRTLK